MLPKCPPAPVLKKNVLDVGSGDDDAIPPYPLFRNAAWEIVRLDIDPAVNPNLIGSITNLDEICSANSFNAVLSSHSIEHLFAHEVLPAIKGFHRILKPDGFVVITCPDLEAVLAHALKYGLDTEVYASPAGPITGLDMVFGHTRSISLGNTFMAHKTGFTSARLGNVLIQAGFATVFVERIGWDLWAVGLREHADQDEIRRELCAGGLLMSF